VPSNAWLLPRSASSVDKAPAAGLVPESTAEQHCTVHAAVHVVITVIRREHLSILDTERIASVTPVPADCQRVVGRFAVYRERTVLGPVPTKIEKLQLESQLVAAVMCQLMQQVVAEPVVASRVIESDFKLRPRTVEGVRSVNFLLD